MTPRLEGDGLARQIIRTRLDESLLVEASAGTGKTCELVNRVVAVLRAGLTSIDRIVAVTFTHKAAGELKVRLRQELDQARATAAGRELENLESAIGRLEEAAIGTIHSFCAQVLRERPVEACVDPAFKELSEREQQRIYDRAFRSWFERALDQNRPGLRRALSRLAWTSGGDGLSPSAQLRMDGKKLVEWRDFRTLWTREPFDRPTVMRELAKSVMALARLSKLGRINDALYQALRPARDMDEWLDRYRRMARSPDYDAIEALMLKLLGDLKRFKQTGRAMFSGQVTREAVIRARDELIGSLELFKRRADADFSAELQSDMLDLIGCYEEMKQRSGKLDFVDLLVKVRDLVSGNAEVRRHLQQRFTHFFIDEFQDTDPVQAEILLLLSAGDSNESDWRKAVPKAGKLFIVGDPKQSIYKFRRADVLLYQEVRDSLVDSGVRLVQLSVSHRASRPIQDCVNAAFEPEMTESREKGQPGYVPLEGALGPIGDQPSVIALPVPGPWGQRGVTRKAINARLPDTVAAFIDWLIRESGWKVRSSGETDALVPIEARHIAVLFRRFVNYGEDITRGYVGTLEARGIRHLLVGSKSFHQREEVETLRAACTAIEWPSDELSVYATLKGSLFAIPDNLLLRYRFEVGHVHPLRPPVAEPVFACITEVLDILADLHRKRNERPVAETMNVLLETARAHAGFSLRRGGHHVISNVYRLIELARNYELSGGISFRGFVEELSERSERSDSGEAPMVEESADGVRLMTVHTAKGLEFPVVILADMTANIAARDPDRYLDPARKLCAMRLLRCAPQELADHDHEERSREEAEGVRVAYVAATRARDLLVIPALNDGPLNGSWLKPLDKAIYSKTVHWFNLGALKLDVGAKLGLTDYRMLTGNSTESFEAYESWRAERAQALERGSTPTFEIANPTDMPDAPAGISVEFVGTSHDARPYGPRFGTLVHVLLRDWVLNPAAASVHGQTLGAEDDETEAAVGAARRALEHPLIMRARSAVRCLREVPVSLRLDDDHIMEGSIDLAFEEDGTWHVIDYKTDSPSGALLAKYERQVSWYGAALARITGRPVRCHLLSV